MTYSQALAVSAAKRDVGFHEGRNNSNPYSWWQYRDYTNPYCASAVSMWSYEAGYRFHNYDYGEKGDSNCTRFRLHAMRDNIWTWGSEIRSGRVRIQPGDLIIETFGIPDQHIEICVQDDGGSTVLTIGGNTLDGVYFRVRPKSCVVGIIRLRDGGQSIPVPQPPHPIPVPPKEEEIMDMSSAINGDGRPEIFMINEEKRLYHKWREATGGTWSTWVDLSGELKDLDAVTAFANPKDHRLEVFVVIEDGGTWHRWQESGGKWSDWQRV